MSRGRLKRARIPLWTPFVLVLGMAIGYSLNLQTARLVFGRPVETRMAGLPTYVVEPPDVLLLRTRAAGDSEWTSEEHLVGSDGRVTLIDGPQVYVTGMTIEQARDAIAAALGGNDGPEVVVDIFSFNSKAYYVVQRNAAGDTVARVPITGNETVMDALAATRVAVGANTSKLSVHRPAANGVGRAEVLQVQWNPESGGVTPSANYQLFPGDRVVIEPIGRR